MGYMICSVACSLFRCWKRISDHHTVPKIKRLYPVLQRRCFTFIDVKGKSSTPLKVKGVKLLMFICLVCFALQTVCSYVFGN